MAYTNHKKISFGEKFFSKCVDITDPCYDRGSGGRLEALPVEEGIYECFVTIANFEHTNMKELMTIEIKLKDSENENWLERIGNVFVDSGLVGFFEDKPDFDDDEWLEFLKKVPTGNWAWNIDEGFLSLSGIGDGEYSVHGQKNKNGKYTHFLIDFLSDNHDEF